MRRRSFLLAGAAWPVVGTASAPWPKAPLHIVVPQAAGGTADVLARMLDGELVESALDVRVIRIGIAARCVFVVVAPSPQLRGQGASESFRFEVERLISDARRDFSGARSPRVGSGGSSSGPAELCVVEWGVTIPRKPS